MAAGMGNPFWLAVLMLAVAVAVAVAVAASALRGLRRGGDTLFAAAGRAAALSLGGSAGVGILAFNSTATVGFGVIGATPVMIAARYALDLPNSTSWPLVLSLAAGIIAVQVMCSTWWLSRHRFGPLEWAWRWVTWGARPATVV